MIRKVSAFLVNAIIVMLVVVTISQAQPQTLLTRHVREAVVKGQAQLINRLPATQTMRLEVVLPLRNRPELESFLHELYDPSSACYRKFLTVEEFTTRFGPTQGDYDAAVRFAKANGFTVTSTSRNRMNIGVKGTVANIEKAFHVTMGLYQHPTEKRTFYAPDREPTVALPFQLWRIAGLDNYSIPRSAITHRNVAAKPEEASTGSCPGQSFCGSDMRAAYYEGTNLTGAGQTLGLLEYLGTDLSDLTTYYTNVGQTLNVPITLVSTDGTATTCYGCEDTEQTLDMTQALGMAPGLASLVMYVGSTDAALLNGMATATPLNAQLSSSWTWGPADPTTDDPYFEEFAAQGQTFFNAAGDGGYWAPGNYEGYIFPADDAFVVSVGGTVLETTGPGGPWSSETAWTNGGGGISNSYFPTSGTFIPSWQAATAAGCSSCSQEYRNAPDVSAEANWDFYVCADQGCSANYYGGTSFAAPMWAGYLALANQQAVAGGQSTLGFIDPLIYGIGLGGNYNNDFHDIISGNNGYSATTGYDLATGWGSPNESNLIDALIGGLGEPTFGIISSPKALTIKEGSSSNIAVAVLPYGGFDGSVTLSASGVPNGITATFTPNPTTSTSTLTLSVAPGAPTDTYAILVSGVSGTLSSQSFTQLKVAPALIPVAALSPTSLTFETVVGEMSKAETLTLANTGNTELNLTKIVASSGFAISSNGCGSTLLAGTKCAIKVTFTPAQPGVRLGTITITDNGQNSPQSVLLSGTGTAQATMAPASVAFPAVKVGGSSPAKTFTLANKQKVALNNISIKATANFSVSANTCTASLAANSSCKISVIFMPTTTGTITGSLQVKDSAVGGPQTSTLTGTGK